MTVSPQLPTQRQSIKIRDCFRPHPGPQPTAHAPASTPGLTLPGLPPPMPPHSVIFSCGEEREGPLHHGAVSRSRLPPRRYAQEGETVVALYPFSGGLETRLRGARAGPREDGAQEARLQGSGKGVRPPRPSLFCSAPHPPSPRHLAHPVGWGGGGCKPVGRGTRGSSPAPPCGAPPTPIVPRGWGRGLQ